MSGDDIWKKEATDIDKGSQGNNTVTLSSNLSIKAQTLCCLSGLVIRMPVHIRCLLVHIVGLVTRPICHVDKEPRFTEDSCLVVSYRYWPTFQRILLPPSSGWTSVSIYKDTRCSIPEDSHFHTRHRENLKSKQYRLINCSGLIIFVPPVFCCPQIFVSRWLLLS
jgi:hypothetical protein